MLIKIHNSKLFDTDPAMRFAEEYGVEPMLWREIWKRFKLLKYSVPDLADYFILKTQRPVRRRNIRRNITRWIFLTEVYVATKTARDMGAQVVNTEIFGSLEQRVVDEVTRHLQSGSTRNSRTMA